MNLSVKAFTLTLLVLGAAGCQTQKSIALVGNGYQEVTYTPRAVMGEPPLPRIAFEHRGANGKATLVWPALYCANDVIKGELAIFVGDKGYVEDGDKVTHPRLFAVQPPELPLDITDEVLWRWAKSTGKNFGKTLNNFSLVTPEEDNGQLKLELEFFTDDKDWPDKSELQLDWNQVAEIMRAVKTKGVLEKDLRWQTPYIGEKF
jgi:hypothetical protein